MLQAKTIYIGILAFVQLLGLLFFCKGFFPYKIYLSGYATQDDQPSLFQTHNQEPEFDRLVFVLIDALRNDFILGEDSGFEFVNQQIKKGMAYPFTSKATAPTVTLPRIKAITTGTIPSFLDAILNIAESDTSSSLKNHDNWVYQFKNKNKKINFFGDDTWMRLFPDLFTKTDGTTSFFVSDTVEVDLNVTRHIKTDLVKEDWDATIFHYLGLDHIGHLGGPNSPLMKPKQMEMDEAIESIYRIVAQQDKEKKDSKGTLIVVCGDHGMNEKGNHGGSSIGETSAGLVFLSPKFELNPFKHQSPMIPVKRSHVFDYPIIDQIDIVPTLAYLFSFPIPKNNLGKLILDFHSNDVSKILNAVQLNAYQIGQLLIKLMPELSNVLETPLEEMVDIKSIGHSYVQAVKLHQEYQHSLSSDVGKEAIQQYYEFIRLAQAQLANTATDYNLNFMIFGVVLITASALGFIYKSVIENSAPDSTKYKYVVLFVIILYSASMFASSFVEEEHMTWYFWLQTMTFISVLFSSRLAVQSTKAILYPIGLCFLQFVTTRLLIEWNHTELSSQVLRHEMEWHIIALTLTVNLWLCIKTIRDRLQKRLAIDVHQTTVYIRVLIQVFFVGIVGLTSVLVLIYKVRQADHTGLYQALTEWELVRTLSQVGLGKLIFNYAGAGLFVLWGLSYVTQRANQLQLTEQAQDPTRPILTLLLRLVTPLAILFSARQNALLFLVFQIQFEALEGWEGKMPVWHMSFWFACQSQAGFFLTGHTNSMASVDLSNAYIGVEAYDTFLIGLLTFVSNWSGSLWWAVASWVWMEDGWESHVLVQSSLFSTVLALLSVSVTVLREHLFIWTVFSPKYLYQIAWTCLYHWAVQVVLGSLVTQVLFKSRLNQEVDDDDVDEFEEEFEEEVEEDFEEEVEEEVEKK